MADTRTRRRPAAAIVSGAIVLAAALTAGVVLGVHGAETRARAGDDTVPSELAATVLYSCVDWSTPGVVTSMSVDTVDGHLVVGLSGPPERAVVAHVLEASANECLANYRVDGLPFHGASLPSTAERLLAYDVAERWLLPCLSAHDMLPSRMPTVESYLSTNDTPWPNYYASEADLDTLLTVYRDCGAGDAPLHLD